MRDAAGERYKQLSLCWNGRRGTAHGFTVLRRADGYTTLLPVNRGRLAPAGEYRVQVSLRRARAVLSPPASSWWRPADRCDVCQRRALAMLAVLVVTPALLLADIWRTSQLTHLRHHPAEAGAAIVLGVIVVIALAVLIHREPQAFPLLAIFALPFRLPIATDGSTSNLLIPLYLVVGAGALAYLTSAFDWRRGARPPPSWRRF